MWRDTLVRHASYCDQEDTFLVSAHFDCQTPFILTDMRLCLHFSRYQVWEGATDQKVILAKGRCSGWEAFSQWQLHKQLLWPQQHCNICIILYSLSSVYWSGSQLEKKESEVESKMGGSLTTGSAKISIGLPAGSKISKNRIADNVSDNGLNLSIAFYLKVGNRMVARW